MLGPPQNFANGISEQPAGVAYDASNGRAQGSPHARGCGRCQPVKTHTKNSGELAAQEPLAGAGNSQEWPEHFGEAFRQANENADADEEESDGDLEDTQPEVEGGGQTAEIQGREVEVVVVSTDGAR